MIIFLAVKYGEALYSQQKQDWELTVHIMNSLFTKFRFKLNKVEKATRPFQYDLNQIPYDYKLKVTNIQGNRSHRQSAWKTMDRGSWHCMWCSDQNHPSKQEMWKGNMVVWWGIKNSWEKTRSKRQSRKAKIYPSECRVSKNKKKT